VLTGTNAWLSRLGAGCQVVIQDLVGAASEQETAGERPTARRLRLRTEGGVLAVPMELGAGISQVLPVIVAALETNATIALVEQPELHVHPRLQVGLGDLFIEATTRERHRKMMIVETHSEHLILRVLRRIRETVEGEVPAGARGFDATKLSVLHVRGSADGVRIQRLHVDQQGEFTDRWPDGFFDERFDEIYGR
jgi:predicted ATPase